MLKQSGYTHESGSNPKPSIPQAVCPICLRPPSPLSRFSTHPLIHASTHLLTPSSVCCLLPPPNLLFVPGCRPFTGPGTRVLTEPPVAVVHDAEPQRKRLDGSSPSATIRLSQCATHPEGCDDQSQGAAARDR